MTKLIVSMRTRPKNKIYLTSAKRIDPLIQAHFITIYIVCKLLFRYSGEISDVFNRLLNVLV
jgi:hypothetical protein